MGIEGSAGALFGAGQPDRPHRRRPSRPGAGQGVLPGPAHQGPSRQRPGGRKTDAADLPAGTGIYALQDLERLQALAAAHGPAVGAYARGLLDTPLPSTRMRQVYALLGLVKEWGPELVKTACARALDAEVMLNVGLIGRMILRATETEELIPPPVVATEGVGRSAGDAGHFAVTHLDDSTGAAQ